ncbi:MAG: rRNA maturation RNase YbeY [Smithellaceae bacterium]|nr:rRNA maturation RNase YbeY [Smithellaceae bacterium]
MKILIENRQKKISLRKQEIRSTLGKIMRLLACRDNEVSVLIVDNEQIRAINKAYLKRDRPTNVISFSMREGEHGAINPTVLGDIIISAERAEQDAQKEGIALSDEMDFLLIHGLLHLLGFNHESVSREKSLAMKAKERDLFLALKGYELGES